MVRKLSDACRRVLGGFYIKIRYIKIYIRFLGKKILYSAGETVRSEQGVG